MSTCWMHNDEQIFPEPDCFEPKRWLQADSETTKAMKMHFVPFATGSRQCVGQK